MNPMLSCPELLSKSLDWEVRPYPSTTLTWMCAPQVTASSQALGLLRATWTAELKRLFDIAPSIPAVKDAAMASVWAGKGGGLQPCSY